MVALDAAGLLEMLCRVGSRDRVRRLLVLVALAAVTQRDGPTFDVLRGVTALDPLLGAKLAAQRSALEQALAAWARPPGRPAADAPDVGDRWCALSALFRAMGPEWGCSPSALSQLWHRSRRDGTRDVIAQLVEASLRTLRKETTDKADSGL